MPAPATAILAIVGFCAVEASPLGPLQFQLVASVAFPAKVNEAPAQIGFGLADAVTDDGIVFTVTEAVVTAVAGPHALLAVNVYMPASAVDIVVIVGLCKVDAKLFGPLQLQLVAAVAPPVNVKAVPAQSDVGDAEAVTVVGSGHVAQNTECQMPFAYISKQ